MERYKTIIEKGRVDFRSVSTGGILDLIFRAIIVGICLYVLYSLYFLKDPNAIEKPIAFYKAVFVILTTLSVYFFIIARKKLKVQLYSDKSNIERKRKAVEKCATDYKWKLKKSELNYYFFWENNLIFQSYYVTIVLDEEGFYINSYPSFDRVFDFGASQKNSDEIYELLKEYL